MTGFTSKVTISYHAEGARNALGEPARTLTTREANVPALLQNKSPKLMFDFPAFTMATANTGQSNIVLKILFIGRNKTINTWDTVTDADGNTYVVAAIAKHKSHTAALLQGEA